LNLDKNAAISIFLKKEGMDISSQISLADLHASCMLQSLDFNLHVEYISNAKNIQQQKLNAYC